MRPRKDHLWNNNFNRIYFLCVHVLGRDLPGNQKLCGKDACFFWLISQSEVNMGSGNSAPVERAQTVETEAHQDVFELRFDHLAFGGTSILFLAALIGLCWFCRRRNKRRQRKRQNKTCHCHQSPTTQPALPMNQSYPMQPDAADANADAMVSRDAIPTSSDRQQLASSTFTICLGTGSFHGDPGANDLRSHQGLHRRGQGSFHRRRLRRTHLQKPLHNSLLIYFFFLTLIDVFF